MEERFITLINHLSECIQRQYSYMSFLGIISTEMEQEFNEVVSKIIEFGDERMQVPTIQNIETSDTNFCKVQNSDQLNEPLNFDKDNHFGTFINQRNPKSIFEKVILNFNRANLIQNKAVEIAEKIDEDIVDLINDSISDSELELVNDSMKLTHEDDMPLKKEKSKTPPKKKRKPKKKLDPEMKVLAEKYKTGPSNKPYQCVVCKSNYNSFLVLIKHPHMREYLGLQKYHQCELCSKNFKTKWKLKIHMRSHTKPFKCDQCESCFAAKGSLVSHHELVHEGKTNHLCNICGKSFTQRTILNEHMTIHTGEKRFKCEFCTECFRTQQQLKYHRYKHDEVQLPCICEICSKGFIYKRDLDVHMRNHTGIRPFVCNMCPKTYIAKKHLVLHQKKHKL